MDFTLSKKHEMARTLFKEFAEKEVKPLAQDVDENEQFPVETVAKMAKAGFLGIPVPKEYGGQGCDPLTYVMCVEELSKVCGTTGVIVSAHTSLCIDPIQTFGTEEQKKKYIPDLASGKKLGAFGLTEPGAGTDAQGQQTKAVLDGDEWVLNGSKCFITNGSYADVYIVIAVTGVVEKRGRKMKEISAFIVEKGTPGFTFGTKEKKMGIRGSATCELILKNVRVSKDDILGKEGQGLKMALASLDSGRMGIATQALGIAQGAIDETIRYVKERKQFGKRISQFQNTQFKLAELQTKRIIAPINKMDPDNLQAGEVYDELAPLVRRLEKQKETIRGQMQILREKQEEFSAITENMQEGFLVVDSRGDVMSYNKLSLIHI